MELERGRSKEKRNNKSAMYRMWKKRCYRRKSVKTKKERDLVFRI